MEIVKEIIQAENQAEALVNRAREQASQIRAEGEKWVNENLSKAKTEAKEQLKNRVEKARVDSEGKVSQTVDSGTHDLAEYLKSNEKLLDTVASEIVAFVLTPEYKRD